MVAELQRYVWRHPATDWAIRELTSVFDSGRIFKISCFGCKGATATDSHVWWVIFCFFLTVYPWVLSLQVLYICYCSRPCKWNGKTAGERLATDTKTSKDSIRIQDDVESNVHMHVPAFLREAAVGLEHAGVILTAHILHHRGVRHFQPCGQFEPSDSSTASVTSACPRQIVPKDTVTAWWTYSKSQSNLYCARRQK